MPTTFVSVLAKAVGQISAEAEEKVRRHLQRFDHRGEIWIRQGLGYVKDESCPFCGQGTSNATLLKLYATFFSNAYRELVVEIERAGNLLEQTLGDSVLGTLQKRILENDARIQGWADLANLKDASYRPDQLEKSWIHLRTLLRQYLDRKAANPSDMVAEDAPLVAAVRDYADAAKRLADHNSAISTANGAIGELKKQAASTQAETLEAELRRLRNMEIRSTAEVSTLVTTLRDARAAKKKLEETKRAKRTALETTAAKVLETYQSEINRLLEAFGANFSIINARPSFAGGKASSTYQLELNKTKLDTGDAGTPRGKPCFRTALSTGDKSTLALAFFLARLEQEDLSGRCVVIDDPLSSFDSFRIACTQQEIVRPSGRAAQLVVLSHDAFFLKSVLDEADKKTAASLQVVREGKTHVLRPWDVADYFLREAHHEYFLLRQYYADGPPDSGDLTSIARAIRPYLEGHLRHRYPDEFKATEWLGDFIAKVRAATSPSPLARLLSRLTELEALNDYSKKFHHTSSPPASRPNDSELRPWVNRAITFVQAG